MDLPTIGAGAVGVCSVGGELLERARGDRLRGEKDLEGDAPKEWVPLGHASWIVEASSGVRESRGPAVREEEAATRDGNGRKATDD